MKKVTAFLLALLLMASMLTGCFSGTKEFTCQDLTISVPSRMKDVSSKSDFSSFTFALDSSKIAIFGLREKFSDFDGLDGQNLELKEYANLLIKANSQIAETTLPITRSNQDYIYFTYEAQTDEGLFEYLTGCYKGEEAFWMVQIAAKKTDFELETFLGYLDTVKLG